MEREVNRLLAGLSTLGSRPDHEQPSPRKDPASMPPSRRTDPATQPPPQPRAATAGAPTRGDRIALWTRVFLGVALGGAMTQWPYPHICDLALLGYLGAVAALLITGAWIAFESWRMRGGAPHVLSLILVFWGIVLAAEQVLPRIGYAAEPATWRCTAEAH
jgi:hypothetical protein